LHQSNANIYLNYNLAVANIKSSSTKYTKAAAPLRGLLAYFPAREVNTMKKYNVLLVCGGGTSTGFMAANMRKVAKQMGMDIEIKSRSETEVEVYAPDADCIMLGTHLAYLEDEMKQRTKEHNCAVFVMDKSYYSTLDGEGAINDMLKHMEGKA
jgi:PTS system cellobiose-specific IIB component